MPPPDMASITITPEMLSTFDAPDVDFIETEFFKKGFEPPDPETVILHGELQRRGFDLHAEEKDEELWDYDTQWLWRQRPVIFPELNLVVKWGGTVRREEGLTMIAIRGALPDFPVPEVYGWRTDGQNAFLYMELIDGRTLDSSLEDMTADDHESTTSDLQTILDELARLKQGVNDQFVEPFPPAREFHDRIAKDREETFQDGISRTLLNVDPHRGDLPDSIGIRFTHCDFQPSNIIFSTTRPYRVVGLVDWEEAGWMPAYWEGSKASYKSLLVNEWETAPGKLFGEERDEKVHIAWSC